VFARPAIIAQKV